MLTVLSGTSIPGTAAEIVSLGQILSEAAESPSSIDEEFPRLDRLSVALIVAQSMLELCPSPWLPYAWNKNDIHFFVDKKGRIMSEHPFLVCRNRAASPVAADSSDFSGALLSLGTLVLEMWYAKPLESQPFWRAYSGPDGSENEFARRTAAISWQSKMRTECGYPLHSITRWCIFGDFGPGDANLDNQKLVQDVYNKVVRELEAVLHGFEGL